MSSLKLKPSDRQTLDLAEQTTNKVEYIQDTYNYLNDRNKYPSLQVVMDGLRGLDNFIGRYFDSETQFLDWVKNSAPIGSYAKLVQISGTFYTYIISKATSQYGAVIRFGYGGEKVALIRLVAGSWGSEFNLTNQKGAIL